MKSPSIVFFGSGDISLATLQALAESSSIEAVVTKPDSLLHGKAQATPVKQWAESQSIPYYTPANKAELAALFERRKFASPLGAVAEYGLIIPAEVIEVFARGIINSHFSLLPRWRGADPIRAVILHGDRQTGVSLIKITPGLDDGDLLAQSEYALPAGITAPQLTTELIKLNNQLLTPTLNNYLAGKITLTPQPRAGVSYAPRIIKSAGQVDWNKPAVQIEREVRAYLGWPGSHAQIGGKDVVILRAKLHSNNSGQPGIVISNPKQLIVQTKNGQLEIESLKPAGKNSMSGAEFIRGYLI